MTKQRSSVVVVLALLTAGAFASVLLPQPIAAQDAAADEPRPEGPFFGRHIEGGLAFLHTELKISEAQAVDWDRFAGILRQRAATAGQRRATAGPQDDLVARMERRVDFAAARAAALREELDAFRPLYASMSDEQKRTAAELLGHHLHHHP